MLETRQVSQPNYVTNLYYTIKSIALVTLVSVSLGCSR